MVFRNILYKFKIRGLLTDRAFNQLPFGRQVEFFDRFTKFKATAKCIHLSQKRKSYSTAIRQAIDLYRVEQYYCIIRCDGLYKDDSFQFWYVPHPSRELASIPILAARVRSSVFDH